MKLLAIEMSRLTVLLHVGRSEGQLFLPQAVSMLNARYGFSSYPSSYDEITSDRMDFKLGQFEGSAIESLELYGDGIIVTSRSDTDFIDRFFADLCQWIVDDLGLSIIKTHSIDRLYESNLIVETSKDVLKPLEAMASIGKLVEAELKKTSELEVKYQPFGWAMAADQAENPSLKPISFRIERRLGTEFAMQQFITTAPLKTKQHMDVLKKLESLV